MTAAEKVVQQLLAERGYLVMGSNEPLQIGRIVDADSVGFNRSGDLDIVARFAVIGLTNQQDADCQAATLRRILGGNIIENEPHSLYFYKLSTD